jgi:hypothetical protein
MYKLSFLLPILFAVGCGSSETVETGSGNVDVDGDGYVASDDCDDEDYYVNPEATEVCGDGVDNDCDGLIDDGSAVNAKKWYVDNDRDGFGDMNNDVSACAQPEGFVADALDCNDADPAFHPGAQETDCNDPNDYNCDGFSGFIDNDKDGWAACAECNDGDPTINPGADELCFDKIDNNCDGNIDDPTSADATAWYLDYDSDGYGAEAFSEVSCFAPSDAYISTGGDCDDHNASIFPGADEHCDGIDNDCDTEIDEDAIDATTWYADTDSDTYGDPATGLLECVAPDGFVADSTDCNDSETEINPAEEEVCDNVDNNCDGNIDENAVDATHWHADSDVDDFGNPDMEIIACEQPTGYVEDDTDCNDSDAAVNPLSVEYCNAIDDNCDGDIDENTAADASTWYLDSDGDTYGTSTVTWVSCAAPEGFVANGDDCNDLSTATYPGAPEYCDRIDTDCDAIIDEPDALDASTWYADDDGDTYGDPDATLVQCYQPSGYVADDTDCNDASSFAHPGAVEYCNDADDDCNGSIDDAARDATTWYADADSDGFGNDSLSVTQCDAPTGYTDNRSDCDDTDEDVNPDATEYCNGYDDNCDGYTDESTSVDASTWYLDYDSDGHGNVARTTVACTAPASYVALSDDCNDLSATAYPGATEYCDTLDNDCDGTVDENSAVDAETWYRDSDTDTFGNSSVSTVACAPPSGYVASNTDCDDTRATVHPYAPEYCNSLDDNCDGTIDEDTAIDAVYWYPDRDGDGYGYTADAIKACSVAGYGRTLGDCDDTNDTIYPGATEYCDFADNNCDGVVDNAAVDATTWYIDADGDTYGDPDVTRDACTVPSGYVADNTDCNDDPDDNGDEINPGAQEICNNAIDDNCDGTPATCEMTLLDNADLTITGEGTNDAAGWLAQASDINGDGHTDLVMTAYKAGATEFTGSVYVFYGPVDPSTMGSEVNASTADVILTGGYSTLDQFGYSVGTGGDVNGDGYDDLLVGANTADYEAKTNNGITYLLLGGPTLTSGTPTPSTSRMAAYASVSYAYVGTGTGIFPDTDGDGLSDIAYGAISDKTGSAFTKPGTIFVGYTTDSTYSTSGTFSAGLVSDYVSGGATNMQIGDMFRTDLDVDGDGSSDLLIGAYNDTTAGAGAGAAALFYMPISGMKTLSTADVFLTGVAAGDYAGKWVSSAGDYDDDGYDDFLVGAYTADHIYSDAGAAYLVLGGSGLASGSVSTRADATFWGATASEKLGSSVTYGDFDGDGQLDLQFGSANALSTMGSSYIVYGPSSGSAVISDVYDVRLDGDYAGDGIGNRLRYVGDLDESGKDTIALPVQGLDIGYTDAGGVYLIYGITE